MVEGTGGSYAGKLDLMADTPTKVAPPAQSTAELFKYKSREYILMAGKDGVGKSCALVALATWIQTALNPAATVFVIDTENKFPTALRSFGSEAPTNITYYKCESMDDVNLAFYEVMRLRKADDWLLVESMARIWEKAQDLAYKAVSGYEKAEYLEIRRTKVKGAPVVPKPDEFWNIAKGAHDSEFLDVMSQTYSLNVVMTTTTSAPPKAGGKYKENATRAAVRSETGLDVGMDGAPRLPTYVETTLLMENIGGNISCRILRDNLSALADPKQTFEVPDRKLWGMLFYSTCRV